MGYTNSCIHSGSNAYTSGDTAWYNYALATAGTITGIDNIDTANETICPKGWTMPTRIQVNANTNVAASSPVFGGHYNDGTLYRESDRGYWWTTDSFSNVYRHSMNYDGSRLYSDTSNARFKGFYIRCVSEEKTVTDLTYMQDMTPSIANWTPTLADAEAFI